LEECELLLIADGLDLCRASPIPEWNIPFVKPLNTWKHSVASEGVNERANMPERLTM